MILPPRLLLLTAPVMIERERGDTGLAGGVGEQEGGTAAVRPHFEEGETEASRFYGDGVQGESLIDRHESLGRLECGEDVRLGRR